MDLLIGLAVIGLIGLTLFGLFGLVFIGWTSRKDAQALRDEPDILDDLFNGDALVTTRTGIGTLPLENVVVGGRERGYRLAHHMTEGTSTTVLVFELEDAVKVRHTQPDESANAVRDWVVPAIIGAAITLAGLIVTIGSPQAAALGIAVMAFGAGLTLYARHLRTQQA